MLKLVEWAVPLMVSVLLIQIVSDMLYMCAVERPAARLDRSASEKQRFPVHVIDREATPGSVIT